MSEPVRVFGTKQLGEQFRKLAEAGRGKVLAEAAMAGALRVETFAKLSMGENKTGPMYDTHRASAPGEAPAIDTGALVNSILSELVESSDTSATAAAGTNTEYAAYLEYGTSKMAPRPFMRPAIEDHEQAIVAAMRGVIKAAVDEAERGGNNAPTS